MKYRWVLRPMEKPDVAAQLQRELNDLPEALARLLVMRGIESFDDARHFFRAGLEDLHDPFLMLDMDAAADRLVHAIENGERVLVYGDYDVDGTTSTALMTSFLRSLGVEADFFIPDRFEDGYGLGPAGIDYAAETGAALIVALDCGITAHEQALYAKSKGLDLIICDHHTPLATVPDAVAVLDPKRPDCPYPFKELSGCGVGFKLMQAVLRRLGEAPALAHEYLDLVAVSIASDIVPLYGENRVLMREGLRRLAAAPRLGLHTLAELAGLDLDTCSTDRIVFVIGPRINAAGRMGDAGRAAALLMETDPVRAADLARQLEKANEERRSLDRDTLVQATRKAERQITAKMRHSLVLHDEGWHLGVLGIVASRLVERFYRPTIMLSTAGDVLKGSARSIAGFNIYNALDACRDLLDTFGGHDHAAGLALREENLTAFQDRFDEIAKETLTAEMMLPAIEIDAPIHLDTIDGRFWNVLRQFAPFGPENGSPIFHASDLEVSGSPRTVGAGQHLKFHVRQRGANGKAHPVIGFGLSDKLDVLEESARQGKPFELLFSLQENTWKGTTTLQLRARDLRLSSSEE